MKLNFSIVNPLAVALAGAMALSGTAHAQILAQDDFSGYGAAITAGPGNATGFSGNWNVSNASDGYLYTVRTASPIAYPNDTIASGSYYLNLASGFGGPNPNSVTRSLNTSAGGSFAAAGLASGGLVGADNATLYGSFEYSSDTSGWNGSPFLQFSLGSNTFNAPISYTPGVNMIVFKINYGATANSADDSITIWDNPNLSSLSSFNSSASTTASNLNLTFNTFQLTDGYTGGSGPSPGGQTSIDDILFGKGLSDVTGLAVSAPEPSSSSLLVIGGLITAFVMVNRRKSARL